MLLQQFLPQPDLIGPVAQAQASHQQRASHQTLYILFLAHNRCLRDYDFVLILIIRLRVHRDGVEEKACVRCEVKGLVARLNQLETGIYTCFLERHILQRVDATNRSL